MAYAPHMLVNFGGPLSAVAGSDIWSCNLRFSVPDPALADYDGFLIQIKADLGSWFESGLSDINPCAGLEYCKANGIDAAGHYIDPTTTHRIDYTPGIGGGGAGSTPWIISAVMSFRTARGRGPGSHGRIYVPNQPSATELGSMFLTESSALRIATAGKALLNVFMDRSSLEAVPVVASKKDASLTPITRVLCGSVMDVQERRKNALTEGYTAVAL